MQMRALMQLYNSLDFIDINWGRLSGYDEAILIYRTGYFCIAYHLKA